MYCDWPQLGRCCFCMPLRRGVITFGYIHIVVSAITIGMYSAYIVGSNPDMLEAAEYTLNGIKSIEIPVELSITFYCLELIFDALMIYGAHRKAVNYLKAYFYYTVGTGIASLVMQIVGIFYMKYFYHLIETFILFFASLSIQVYLITIVWSLIKKLEVSGPQDYDNKLHQVVTGELPVQPNGIYSDTTVVHDV